MSRAAEIERELSDPATARDPRRLADLGREHSRLAPVMEMGSRLERYENELAQARELVAVDDPELAAEARAEEQRLRAEIRVLEATITPLLIPRDPLDERDCIVEIRAGTGGDEAALFAADLYRMYTRFIERQGWRVTSAATVAVLPEAEEVDVKIDEKDLRIDVFRSSGPGGQGVNTTDSAVRITHIPSGIVVSQQDQRSQIQNRARAMEVLRARLLDLKVAEQEAERSRMRKTQVGTGDRSAKIRTYNFPQNRVTDHRIGLTMHELSRTLDGEIEELIAALREADTAERLSG
jgi:peptide chain release factor 1